MQFESMSIDPDEEILDDEESEETEEENVVDEFDHARLYGHSAVVDEDVVAAFINEIRVDATDVAALQNALVNEQWRLTLPMFIDQLNGELTTWREQWKAWKITKKGSSFRVQVMNRVKAMISPNQSARAASDLSDELARHGQELEKLISKHGPIILAHYRDLTEKGGAFAQFLGASEGFHLRSIWIDVAKSESDEAELIASWQKLRAQFDNVRNNIDSFFQFGGSGVEKFNELLATHGLPSYEKVHPLVWMGLAKPTTKGKVRADGVRGISVNAFEGPREKKEKRANEKGSARDLVTSHIHIFRPTKEGWVLIGSDAQPLYERLLDYDTTVSTYRIINAASESKQDVKDAFITFATMTGSHVLRSKAFEKNVPSTMPFTGDELSRVREILPGLFN
jgi:hypothetical protein